MQLAIFGVHGRIFDVWWGDMILRFFHQLVIRKIPSQPFTLSPFLPIMRLGKHNPDGTSKRPRRDEMTSDGTSSSDDDNRVKGYVTFRRDTHLSSAITITEIEFILTNRENPQALKEQHLRIVAHIKELDLIHPKEFFSWVLNNLDGIACKTDGPVKELGTILSIARQCTQVSIQFNSINLYFANNK